MKLTLMTTVALSICIGVTTQSSVAQTAIPHHSEEAFASENAIVDTAIPFAIGATEARQSLRGAFGWPTFQEGLVEGVYFRFDPDGYARFSPNPRLDVDVFEVVCKARTNECMGRKGGLSILLTQRGQLQLKFEDALEGDSFYLAEGISEIQVPDRVLLPLDTQLETLLGTATELIVRRGGEEVSRQSLRGFVATTAYLRWIMNRQDYSVLPRSWPVPNARNPDEQQRLTENTGWSSPMARPQVLAPSLVTVGRQLQEPQLAEEEAKTVAELEAELRSVKQMLAELAAAGEPPLQESQPGLPDANATSPAALDTLIVQLAQELDRLTRTEANVPEEVDAGQLQTQAISEDVAIPDTTASAEMEAEPMRAPSYSAAGHLRYLIEDLGLDMRTAVAVLEVASAATLQGEAKQEPVQPGAEKLMQQATLADSFASEDAQLVEELLQGLEAQLTDGAPATSRDNPPAEEANHVAPAVLPEVTVPHYQLLSYYFKSAALPYLAAQQEN